MMEIGTPIAFPKNEVAKTYEAVIDREVTELDIQRFREGVELADGYVTRPAILIPIAI